ncbi:MAG TPA: flagellar biosynthesis protein FlhA [bacterium]|nr:flagellar biosynthesis protein FlhA [bacterium]HPN43187.1 flagellar biosynthesis protein FlhA [bacterium]
MPNGVNLTFLAKHSDIAMALTVIGILIVMIIPIPTVFMDLLLALNIGLALIILLVSMYITRPLQFSVFPGLLLIVTIFRLALNVATTRLILGDGYAGKVISAFGDFVVKGNYVVGFIIFLILVLINFIVITKGAGRVAEVAARFTLDSMPGKQMSIDADLNAGIIDEAESRRRREDISREADFYGAMDGASKFVRGDAIAGLIITALNIIGGFIVGVVQLDMSLAESLRTYTMLTVGDGLVSQLPALIISTAAGMIVTRSASEASMGVDISKQLFINPRVAFIAAGVLFFLGITPGLPFLPFTMLAGGLGTVGWVMSSKAKAPVAPVETAPKEVEKEEEIHDYLRVDAVELEIGYNLIPLVDVEQQGDLLARITQIRKQCAIELGIIIPPIRIRDNMQLKPNEYMIMIRGNQVASNTLKLGHYLALNPGGDIEDLKGVKVKEPAFGLPAVWVRGEEKEKAEVAGYTLVAPGAVLGTHLAEVLKTNADLILTRQDVHELVQNLKKEQSALVDEVIPNIVNMGVLERILKNLLSERVTIRDLGIILVTIADHIGAIKDQDLLTEYVRQALGRSIVTQYLDAEGKINALTLSQQLEMTLNNAINDAKKAGVMNTQGLGFALSTEVLQRILSVLSNKIGQLESEGQQPILMLSPTLRPYFRKLVEPIFKSLVLLSFAEIPANVEIQSLGTVSL